MKFEISALVLSLLAAPAFALSTNSPASHATRVTTDYIDAKISLDYPGFEGLSVDSLGKGHFSLVQVEPPPRPWQSIKVESEDSRVEYRLLKMKAEFKGS